MSTDLPSATLHRRDGDAETRDPLADADQTKRVQAGLAAARARGLDPQVRDAVLAEARASFEQMLRRHTPLAVHQVGRFLPHLRRVGVSREDAVGAAVGALGHAIGKFDPGRGLRFSTYASLWLRQTLQRTIERGSPHQPIRVSWWPLYLPDQDEPPAAPPSRHGRSLYDGQMVRLDREIGDGGRSLQELVGDASATPVAAALSGAVLTDLLDLLGRRVQGAHDKAPEPIRQLLDVASSTAGLDPQERAQTLSAIIVEHKRVAEVLAHPAVAGDLLERIA